MLSGFVHPTFLLYPTRQSLSSSIYLPSPSFLLHLQDTEVEHDKSGGVLVGGTNLVLQKVQRPDAGTYTCRATNHVGTSRSNPLTLSIQCELLLLLSLSLYPRLGVLEFRLFIPCTESLPPLYSVQYLHAVFYSCNDILLLATPSPINTQFELSVYCHYV